MNENELKEKAMKAALYLNAVFIDTNVTNIIFTQNDVIFYEGDNPAFKFTKDEIMNEDY